MDTGSADTLTTAIANLLATGSSASVKPGA
jgi:hypothetical protein